MKCNPKPNCAIRTLCPFFVHSQIAKFMKYTETIQSLRETVRGNNFDVYIECHREVGEAYFNI